MKAYAKLNLFLNILEKQETYHKIDFINTNLNLYDEIELEKNEEIIIDTKDDIPKDNNNLCYQIADKLITLFKLNTGIKISIKKNIPHIGGLGGGSTDAATTLKGMNQLFNLKLSNKQMIDIIKPITTDGCYSIIGGTCRIQGNGEIVTPLNPIKKYYIYLIKPDIKVPNKKTVWMYRNYSKLNNKIQGDINPILDSISNNRDFTIFNAFEQVNIPEYKEVFNIINNLRKQGHTTTLCGSGPTIYVISKEKIDIKYPHILTSTWK